MACIFCKIVSGEIPTKIIGQTENCVAFLDICPLNKGHILVIPKEHYVTLLDLPDRLNDEILRFTKKLAKAVCKALGATDFNIFQRNGPLAGQAIQHFHLHILPRFNGDGHKEWASRVCYLEGEMDQYVSKINAVL